MGKLQNNKANAILDAAVKGKYAVPAVCVVSLHFADSSYERHPFSSTIIPIYLSDASKGNLLSIISKAP